MRTILAVFALSTLGLVHGQTCTDLVLNGDLESATGTGGSGGWASCTTNIPDWVPSIQWPPGATNVGGTIYHPLRSGSGAITEYFTNAVMPDSWDANAANTRYVTYRVFNSGSTTQALRLGLSQTLPAALSNGTKYVVRFRYAAQTLSGSNSTMNAAVRFNTNTACPPSFPGGTQTVGSENYSITGTPVWKAVTACFTASAAHTRIHVGFSLSVPASTTYLVHVDEVELLESTCPFDLDGDGLVGVSDLTILMGYYGLNTDDILNTCHVFADSDCDGVIDADDVDAFEEAFGTICPDGMVLEPGVRTEAAQVKSAQAAHLPAVLLLPNPARDLCTVLHPQLAGKSLPITLVDVNGRVVLQRTTSGNDRTELDIAALPQGTYMATIDTGAEVLRVRLVKE